MTGLELSENIMAPRNDIPVVICSGKSGLHAGAGAGKTGTVNFLMKPTPVNQLLRTVRGVLDAAGAQNGDGPIAVGKCPETPMRGQRLRSI